LGQHSDLPFDLGLGHLDTVSRIHHDPFGPNRYGEHLVHDLLNLAASVQ
jgi:hypothetical protein